MRSATRRKPTRKSKAMLRSILTRGGRRGRSTSHFRTRAEPAAGRQHDWAAAGHNLYQHLTGVSPRMQTECNNCFAIEASPDACSST
jgi:hypothetical protein